MKFEIKQDGDRWLLFRDGEQVGSGTTFQECVGLINALAAQHLAEEDRDIVGEWHSECIPEGEWTSDGRIIEVGATYYREPPMPLMLQTETDIGHFGAELAGSIRRAATTDNIVHLYGDFDNSESGRQARDILVNRERFGISADLGEMDAEFICTEEDEDGWCLDGELHVQRAELIGATMTPFPAFAGAFIELVNQESPESSGDGGDETSDSEASQRDASAAAVVEITAAAAPVAPPAEWFSDPQFTAPTPLTIDEDGRLYGHAALWGECHIGNPDVCVTPPQSQTNYAHFRTGELRPSECDCDPLAVGVYTMGTGHAPLSARAQAAIEHYDNTGSVVADIVTGEDGYGIWMAGALRPSVTDEQLRALRAAAPSGDWRRIGGNLELVAILAVNVPGFPVPRAQVASGTQMALVAAGSRPLVDESDPMERRMHSIEQRLTNVERIARPLRPLAARRMRSLIAGGDPADETPAEANTSAQ